MIKKKHWILQLFCLFVPLHFAFLFSLFSHLKAFVISLRWVRSALTHVPVAVSATVMHQLLLYSRVILRVVSVPASLESMDQPVDSVLLGTGTMDPMAAKVSMVIQVS